MQYLGDFPEDATIYIPFNTFSSDDPQASVTITNLVDADLKVHKDGSATQIATDGATIEIDFGPITGNHLATIDASAHADYSIGSDYMVRMEGTTVDGGTINAWLGSFSIENRFDEVKVVTWNGVDLATTNPLPNAAAEAAGGLYTRGTGAGQINQDANGRIDGNVAFWSAILGVNDDYPSKQSQVSSLAATPGVGARPFVPTSITVTAGTNESGSADDLANDDEFIYTVDDAAGTITLDFDYQLDPDTEVIQYLLVAAAQGNSDDIAFQVRNQVSSAYLTFETIIGSNSLIYANLDKVIIQKYTSDTGLFQVRLTGTGLTSATLTVNKAVAYGQATSTGIKNGSTITLTESAANQNFVGNNWILELEAQILDNMYAEGGEVSGEGIVNSGHAHFNHMEVGSVNVGPSHFDTCGFGSTFIMRTAGDYEMINCHTETPAAGNITIDGNSLGSATSLVIQDFKGSITFINLTSFHTMTVSGTELGNIVLGGADATVKIRGIYESLTNNLTGSPTVTVEAIKASDLNTITGADGVTLATSQPNYAPNTVIPDNAGITDIQSRIPAALVSGRIDSNIGSLDGNQPLATRLKEFVDANVLFSDTAQTGGASTITLAAGTSLIDNDLHDYAVFINGGTGVGQFARINGVIAATQIATIVTPANGWLVVPDNTSTYIILSAGSILHISEIHQAALTQISAEMDDNSTKLAAIVADTDELQTDWTNGGRLDLILDNVATDTASFGIVKNAAFPNFEFPMVLTSDHYTAATGKTVTGEMSIDGADFVPANGAIAEVGSGVYQIDLTSDDTNGDVITYKFSATDCDDTIITVTTRA